MDLTNYQNEIPYTRSTFQFLVHVNITEEKKRYSKIRYNEILLTIFLRFQTRGQ